MRKNPLTEEEVPRDGVPSMRPTCLPARATPCQTACAAGPGAFLEHRAAIWLAFLLAVTFGLCTPASAQTISTVAGTGTRAFSGDGGPATHFGNTARDS